MHRVKSSDPHDASSAHPSWYKDAIIYECRTRSYFDSNGDGVGDLPGLTEKLPYLQDLGITALWLLPLCTSPGRDDGYDISDYRDVEPSSGTLDDFRTFVEQAHKHGVRVITELVLNHTSDAHPWFQRARRAPRGSPERDFYVWSDDPTRYKDARIIFKDFEPSNWSWDRIANAYYWHRFFAHQPDLNFENPAVQEALFGVVDFWFGMGVDGLRLDAVPYLFEQEGTNCENLPQTHAFLRRLRAHVDARFENRLLLAEANQWPEDAAAYFGDGDECHMNFHFPIMPRMFMAIHMEDRFPIVDIMAQTPQLRPNCQWAMFLRNHDELTLEMVTDEERDYMYRAYAIEPSMRINLGIRRRLAPLVGNDRRKMELLNGLLFSLPGTPVLYYGDEIGMGDNVFLGDRNGVRTPMQWSSDRNAGFSRANPQRLILPVIIDPEYHFESLNVEAQQSNSNSLLWWTKRLIALRKRYRAFGWGTMEFFAPRNPRVLAFVREYEGERILVVANLSRFVQYVELDLAKYKGMVAIELFGRNAFPAIGELPYLLTLGGHSFYWFSLEPAPMHDQIERASLFEPPVVTVSSLEALYGKEQSQLEEILAAYLPTRGFYRSRHRTSTRVRLESAIPLDGVTVVLARVDFSEGDPETYLMPIAFVADSAGGKVKVKAPLSVMATLRMPSGDGKLVDATEELDALRPLVDAILDRGRFRVAGGELFGTSNLPDDQRGTLGEPAAIRAHTANTALQYGDRFFLKVYRKLEDGMSPDFELGRFLAVRAPGLSPQVLGALEYRQGRSEPRTLAVLQAFVPNEGTAWSHTRRELGRFYERVLARPLPDRTALLPDLPVGELAMREAPHDVREMLGVFSEHARLLGQRTAEMHLALASAPEDPVFASEPYSALDRRSAYQSLRNLAGRVLRSLATTLESLPSASHDLARLVLAHQVQILARFEPMLREGADMRRIRCHGDYHLEQALWTGKDFVLIDFDGGDHDAALSERRRKHSPLRDLAGMIRSFHYAAYTGLLEGIVRESDRAAAEPWADIWHGWISAGFVASYMASARQSPLLPQGPAFPALLDGYVLAKALSELRGELHRPSSRIVIPLRGIAQLLGLLPESKA